MFDTGIRFTDIITGTDNTDGIVLKMSDSQQLEIWNYENTDILIGTNDVERIRVLGDGKVGIGNTDPNYMLDVTGSINSTNGYRVNGDFLDYSHLSTVFTSGKLLFGNNLSTPNTNVNLHWDNVNKRLGVNKSSPDYNLDVTGDINTTTGYKVAGIALDYSNLTTTFSSGKILYGSDISTPSTSTNLHWDNINSRLGIGTDVPGYSLDVVGDINITGTFKVNNIDFEGGALYTAGSGINISESNEISLSSQITDSIQEKQVTITGAATTITSTDLEINKALLSDSLGKVAASTVTNTELEYLSGVTSAVQTQLDNKQNLLTAGTGINIDTGTNTISSTLVSSQWTTTGNDIHYTTGNIGINTPTPAYNLEVNGITKTSNLIVTDKITTSNLEIIGNTTTINTTEYTAEKLHIIHDEYNGPALQIDHYSIYTTETFSIWNKSFSTNDIIMKVDSSPTGGGKVGINTATPGYPLHVVGDINTSTGYKVNGTALDYGNLTTTFTSGKLLFGNGVSTPSTNTNLHWDNTNSRLGIATATPGYPLHVVGDINTSTGYKVNGTALDFNNLTTTFTSGKLLFGNGVSTPSTNTNLHWDNTNSRLGIGTATPGYSLDVNGTFNCTSLNVNGAAFTGSQWTTSTAGISPAYISAFADKIKVYEDKITIGVVGIYDDKTNLKVWYKFDGTNGTNDSSGNSKHATATGTPTVSNKIISITQPNYLTLPSTIIDFYNDITISFWYRYDNNYSYGRLVSLSTTTNTATLDNKILIQKSGTTSTVSFIIDNQSSADVDFGHTNTSTDVLRHIVWVIKKTSGNWIIYKNGAQVYSATKNYPKPNTYTYSYLGKSNWLNDFNSDNQISMKNFRIYNREITASEISSLYNTDVYNDTTNMTTWYKFDGTNGTNDSSGNGKNATAIGTPPVNNNIISITTNNYITLPDPNFNFNDDITIAFWYKFDNSAGNGRLLEYGALYQTIDNHDNAIKVCRNGTGTLMYFIVDATLLSLDIGHLTGGSLIHLTWVIKKNNTWIIYKNGVSIYNNTQVYPKVNTYTYSYLGKSRWSTGNEFNLDNQVSLKDFRIYNRVLTANEINILYSYIPSDNIFSQVVTTTDLATKQNTLTAGTGINIDTGTNTISSTLVSSQWTTTGNNIHYTTGNVGINTITPTYNLEVNGITKTSNLIVTDKITTSNLEIIGNTTTINTREYTAEKLNIIHDEYSGPALQIDHYSTYTTETLSIWNKSFSANDIIMKVVSLPTGGGRVGINTATPGYSLDVVGDINSSTGYKVNGSAIDFSHLNTTFTSGKLLFGNGVSTPSTNTNLHWDNTNSRLGIGTDAPGYSLDVVGDINITGTFKVNNIDFEGGALYTAGSGINISEANEISLSSQITDSIQEKQATITGAATTITSTDLATNKALLSDALGKVAASTVTDTELGYLSGVTSAVQTQLDNKQDLLVAGAGINIDSGTNTISVDSNININDSRLADTYTNAPILYTPSFIRLTDASYKFLIGGDFEPVSKLNIHSTNNSAIVDVRLTDNTTGTNTTDGIVIRKNTTHDLELWNYENSGIIFGTNNVERIRILSNGNIGIATATPGYPLHVVGDINTSTGYKVNGTALDFSHLTTTFTSGKLLFGDNTSSPSTNTNLHWDNTNSRIGIGTGAPEWGIDLRNSGDSRIQIYGGSSTAVAGLRMSCNNNLSTSPLLYLYAEGTGNTCQINSRYNFPINFYTNNTFRMVISNTGNVGIGITNPAKTFYIHEATGTTYSASGGTITLSHGNNGGASSIVFLSKVNAGSDYGYIQYQDTSTVGGAGENAKLIIGTQNDATDDVILLPSGGVGIGTTAPTSGFELDVNGDVYFRNKLQIYGAGAVAAPANGVTGSTGTRLVLWPGDASNTPYALGMTNNTLWYGTPAGNNHRWYAGTTNTMTLDGSGNLDITGDFKKNGVAIGSGNDTRWTTVNTNDIYLTSTAGDLGVGTTVPISRLTINPIVIDRYTYDHSLSPATITHPTPTSTTVLNDPKEVLNLCRQGTGNQAYGAKASFKLCRWENNSTNSRTRLDINLSHANYDDINIMSIRSDGRVGIGKTNPQYNLDVNGSFNCTSLNVNGTAFTGSSQWTTSSTTPQYISAFSEKIKVYEDKITIETTFTQPTVSGGTITQISGTNYYYASFTSTSGTNTIYFPQNTECQVFIIGGGGGGGNNHSGGGGAGAYYYGTASFQQNITYSITVGAGGSGGNSSVKPNNGSASHIKNGTTNLLYVNGGGAGGQINGGDNNLGKDGGCGGGGNGWDNNAQNNTTYAGGNAVNTGTNGSGFGGGTSINYYGGSKLGGGGGGGIGGVGGTSTTGAGGNGGDALKINIRNIDEAFGGGGGGGTGTNWGGTAGLGGGVSISGTIVRVGGNGTVVEGSNGGSGVVNTGSGGGSAKGATGGAGGSGIVIIRWSNTATKQVATLNDFEGYATTTQLATKQNTLTAGTNITLTDNGNNVTISSTQSGTLGVANGGTGKTSYIANQLLYADTTSSLGQLSLGAGLSITSGVLNTIGDPRISETYTGAPTVFSPSFLRIANTDYKFLIGGDFVPTSKLHIHSTVANSLVDLRFTDSTTGYSLTDGCTVSKKASQDLELWNYENAGMIFGTNNAERVRILANGNIGIGKTNPSYKLDVNGSLNCTSLNVNGTAFTGSSQWTTSGTSIYYNSGNVGIGTSVLYSANTKLTIKGSSYGYSQPLVRIQQDAGWDGNYALEVIGYTNMNGFRVNGNDTANSIYKADAGNMGITTNNGHISIVPSVLAGSGNVGINTFNPRNKLHIDARLSTPALTFPLRISSTSFSDNGGVATCIGMSCESDSWVKSAIGHQRTGPYDVGDIVFLNRNTTDNVNCSMGDVVMRIARGGYVSIGAVQTTSRLSVASLALNSGTQALRFFDKDNNLVYSSSTNLIDVCAIFDSSIWVRSWVASSSDSRIKKNIKDIEDEDALNKILAIEPKSYDYIDQIERGTSNVYGFIAQQIKEVIPNAVKLQKSIVPNIYSIASCYGSNIYLSSNIDISHIDLSSNISIRTIDENGNNEINKIIDYSSNCITINKEISTSNVFVYGTEIEDFHTIDKSYIFTLNVCATQILSSKIDALQQENEMLKQEIFNIKSYLGI